MSGYGQVRLINASIRWHNRKECRMEQPSVRIIDAVNRTSKSTRMTSNKRRVLDALRPVSYEEAVKLGQAPFYATRIAERLELDLSNVSRTLRNLEKQGFAFSESRKVNVWNDIVQSGRLNEREVTCYWNAEHYVEDQAFVQTYLKARTKAADEALKKFLQRFS